MNKTFDYLMNLYGIRGEIKEYRQLTNGHINETYYVVVNDNEYIFQKINSYVFRNPTIVMDNIRMVNNFIINNNKKSKCKIVNFLENNNRMNYAITDNGEFWRLCIYEPNTVTFDVIENSSILQNSGYAFGDFLNAISDFPSEKLNITIPDFHNTRKRLENLFRIIELDENNRAKDVKAEIQVFEKNYDFCCTLIDMTESGVLPLRPVHNDTKYNNILLDKNTLEPICVVDLDTIMPGLVAYDFGDAIRFAGNRSAEDETDLDKVYLDFGYYEQFTKGFIKATGYFMTESEINTLSYGAPIITFELASRFLADYIDGDRYFRIHHKNHNLQRARCQIKLAENMMDKLDEMSAFVHTYIGK